MSKYDEPSNQGSSLEFRESSDLEFPVPTGKLRSWRGTVDPAASLAYCETQLARYWSDPEFVRRRQEQRVNVPFEL